MSRAFVKEDDGDRIEPLPELPVSPHPNYVTARGLEQLHGRLADAEARLNQAAGDEVGAAMARAHALRDANWLGQRIASAQVMAPPASNERVGFGSGVTVELPDGTRRRYRIVGEDEAAPERGDVSYVSPLARALLRGQVGNHVRWSRPDGDLELEVLAIDDGSA